MMRQHVTKLYSNLVTAVASAEKFSAFARTDQDSYNISRTVVAQSRFAGGTKLKQEHGYLKQWQLCTWRRSDNDWAGTLLSAAASACSVTWQDTLDIFSWKLSL